MIASFDSLEGFPAMRKWDPSFRSGHLPPWFKKCIRARYKKMTNGGSCRDCYEYSELRGDLWDHWGSVQRDGFCAVITQPYCDHEADARKWADELGCLLTVSRKGGPWHEATWFFEFQPKIIELKKSKK